VASLRLRCRPHNGYEAERTFGTAFMNGKREAPRHAAAEARARDAHRRVERSLVNAT